MRKGCIYWDKSSKGAKGRRHNIWRADIVINKHRFKKRSKSREVLEQWLEMLVDRYVKNGI